MHSSGLYYTSELLGECGVHSFYSTAQAGNISFLYGKKVALDEKKEQIKEAARTQGGTLSQQELEAIQLSPEETALAEKTVTDRLNNLLKALGMNESKYAMANTASDPKATQIATQTPRSISERLERPYQIKGWPSNSDAQFTEHESIAMCYPFNGCGPVTLFDPRQRKLALVHASRDILMQTDLIRRTVDMMEKSYGCRASQMLASIGPHIQSCCYKHTTIGDSLRDFQNLNDPNWEERLKTENRSKYLIKAADGSGFFHDLKQIAIDQLLATGIQPAQIETEAPCTGCSEHFGSRKDFRYLGGSMMVSNARLTTAPIRPQYLETACLNQ